jgi:hypothetical protein
VPCAIIAPSARWAEIGMAGKIVGAIDMMSQDAASGWVLLPDEATEPDTGRARSALLTIRSGTIPVYAGPLPGPRRRETQHPGMVSVRFAVKLPPQARAVRLGREALSATVAFAGLHAELPIAQDSLLRLQFLALSRERQDALVAKYQPGLLREGPPLALASAAGRARASRRGKLCILSYATDPGAWFPYFYRHYAEIAGAENIFIVSQAPERFSGIKLGGVISVSGQAFKDGARSELMSHLCAGLHSFYEWSLVCDIDEIVIPNPLGGLSFFEELDRAGRDVLLSRGMNILQLPDDPPFNFDLTVLAQRCLAEPLPAMCKHQLARKPVLFSGGFHFCSAYSGFSPAGSGFLNLHLKHACSAMYTQAAQIVETLDCEVQGTAAYFRKVANMSNFGRAMTRTTPDPRSAAISLHAPRMRRYEQAVEDSIYYNHRTGLYAMANGLPGLDRDGLFVDLRLGPQAADQALACDISA